MEFVTATRRPAPARRTVAGVGTALATVFVLGACSAADTASAMGAFEGETRMGPVELLTDDLDGLQRFYTDGVGLSTLSADDDTVVLGADGAELLRLSVNDDRPQEDKREAGLYHSAFLFEDAADLAGALVRTATVAPDSFQGSSDHRVSKAFYFADPDGNGVELYADEPAEDWTWTDGLVEMGSAPLDPNAYIAEHARRDLNAPVGGVSVGHVHLRGGDLDDAESFYADALGFAVTSRANGAVFFAANGYHHHLAVNTWSSRGAGERPDSLGLGYLTVLVENDAELVATKERLEGAGYTPNLEGGALRVSDPWGTVVVVRVAD